MRILCAILIAALCVSFARAAAPKLDWLFPAGVGRDSQVTVTVSDTSTWPVKVWIDDPQGVTIEPHKDKGNLTVKVAADAKAGVRWLRTYNDDGASPPRPFVIGTLPEVEEKETNDVEPQAIEGDVVINGRLAKRNDSDLYRVTLKRGQTFIADLLANQTLGSPMDGVIQLCDADGFVLTQNDDTAGLDSRVVFLVPRDDDYLVRVFAFPAQPTSSISFAGDANYIYRLTLTTGSFADHAMPMAVKRGESTEVQLRGWNLGYDLKVNVKVDGWGDEIAAADSALGNTVTLAVLDVPVTIASADATVKSPQRVELPAAISGRLDGAGREHVFGFTAKKGQTIRVHVESHSAGYAIDPAVRLLDKDGKQLAASSDRRNERNGKVELKVPMDGDFIVALRDLHGRGGMRFVYRLSVRVVEPDFALSLATDSFAAAGGKSLDIPVKIDRLDGFKGDIRIRVEGLPPSVEAAVVTSLEKGPTAKEVKLTLKAAGDAWAGPIRIIGEADGGVTRAAAYSVPATSASRTDPWLSVKKASSAPEK